LQLFLAPLVAQVPIVLLIAAVELDELCIGLGERSCDRIREALDDRAAQVVAVFLDTLDFGALGGRRSVLFQIVVLGNGPVFLNIRRADNASAAAFAGRIPVRARARDVPDPRRSPRA